MNSTQNRAIVSYSLVSVAMMALLLLAWPAQTHAQTEILVYDGITGINSISNLNDTARIVQLLEDSPAEKAGIKLRDRIIYINDSLVSGKGLTLRKIKEKLAGPAGESVQLKVLREGEPSLLNFIIRRESYLHQIEAYEFEYLIDSSEQWTIDDILAGSLDEQFKNPLKSKSTIYSVKEGSRADELGLKPGDQIISLVDVLDRDFSYHVSSGVLSRMYKDTSFTVLREDSLIYIHESSSSNEGLEGVRSEFSQDFRVACAWLKISLVNQVSENREYLINLPYMSGTDSVNVYMSTASGGVVEKKSGILIPLEDRDFIYKGWHAVSLPLVKDSIQTLYLRWKSYDKIGHPLMNIIAQDTIKTHDRYERMVLFGLLGMMVIISVFFLILFFAIQGRQYIYFALYILCFAAFLFVSEGYLGEFLWKEKTVQSLLFSSAQAFIISLLTVFFLLFGNAYLELKKNLKGWFWALVVVLGLIGARVLGLLLSAIFNFEIGGWMEDVLILTWAVAVGFIPLFLLLLPAIFRIQKGFQPAWYFLVANLVLIPLTIITITSAEFSHTEHTMHSPILIRILRVSGVYVAAVLQILIFSFGIAKKMKLDEQEHKKAQLKIIDQLKENEKLKDKVNRELEQKVKERTSEIREQKEEIESQRDEIEAQRDLVFAQKKEITDSIGYAQRIQAAILPHKSYLDELIPDYFVLFKPRDIVSGDFYWIKEVGTSVVIVAADCTGHGVPGAFMSMLGITLLAEQLGKGSLDQPGEILDQLREKVKEMLVQEGTIEEQKDGMDMAIAVIDREQRTLQFAGAYNPLYLVRSKEKLGDKKVGIGDSVEGDQSILFELKGDKQPIGIHWEEKQFTNQRVSLEEGDSVYVFSDGYVDQYGGVNRKKFKTQKFKDLLLSIQAETMRIQKKLLEETFENWKGNIEQIDDVCVIGVRV